MNLKSRSSCRLSRSFVPLWLVVINVGVVACWSTNDKSNHHYFTLKQQSPCRWAGSLTRGTRDCHRHTIRRNPGTWMFLQQREQQQQQQENEQPQQSRRRKKNKYAQFSKVEQSQQHREAKDPMERLIEESEKKLKHLRLEKEEKKNKPRDQVPKDVISKIKKEQKQQKLTFPDTKNIDPYDPTTFGYVEVGTVGGAHGVHGWVRVVSKTDFPKERLLQPGTRHIKPFQKRAPRKIILTQGKPFKKNANQEEEFLLQFDGVYTREHAKKLRGSTLYARQEERVIPDNNNDKSDHDGDETVEVVANDDAITLDEKQQQYLVSDLVGLEVFLLQDPSDKNCNTENADTKNTNNMYVGTVAGVVLAQEMCSTPGLGHDMLEITLPRGIGGTPSLLDELVLIPFVPQIVPVVSISQRQIYITPPDGLLDLTYIREEKVRIKGFLPPASD